jgi:hypothetical protein
MRTGRYALILFLYCLSVLPGCENSAPVVDNNRGGASALPKMNKSDATPRKANSVAGQVRIDFLSKVWSVEYDAKRQDLFRFDKDGVGLRRNPDGVVNKIIWTEVPGGGILVKNSGLEKVFTFLDNSKARVEVKKQNGDVVVFESKLSEKTLN